MIVRIYNEIDPVAAASIQAVMDDGVIPCGLVDTRSNKELTHADLEGRHQAHFFAGAGAWAYAARLAGWPDWWPLWTGSCPCQPFSQAGQRRGVADERHLWPDFFRLIKAARPLVVVGEQVAGKAGYGWLDGVRTDLEEEGYSCRAVDIPACAVDAPNIRQRLYWVALAGAGLLDGRTGPGRQGDGQEHANIYGQLVNATGERWGEGRSEPELRGGRSTIASADAPISGVTLGDAAGAGRQQGQGRPEATRHGDQSAATRCRDGSFWSDSEWLVCHDGKARRTKPGLRLLADGVAGRVHQWRIAGNGINIPLAVEVLAALKETMIEDYGWTM